MASTKQLRIAALSVVALSGIAFWIMTNNREGTLRKELYDFAIEDTGTIDKIYMVSTAGKQLTLERIQAGNWQVNSKHKARTDAIKNLLECIKRMEVRQPVAKSAIENVSKQMATSSTKVEIYQKGTLTKAYYVGSDAQDGLGTFMLLTDVESGENSTLPFIMHIPGFNGFLSIRYFMDEDLWRDRTVFGYLPDQIESVTVDYPRILDSSFKIMLNTSNSISLFDSKGSPISDFDTSKVKQYLNYYSNIQYETLKNDLRPSLKDSVLQKGAVHVLTVKTRDGKTNSVKTFSKPAEPGSKDAVTSQPLTEDKERMYALVNEDKDLAMIQYYVFGKLMPSPSYFRKNKPVLPKK